MPVKHDDFPNLQVFEHPLIHDKITRARNVDTPPAQFRRLLNEIAGLMTYDVCRELKTSETTVQTPMGATEGRILSEPLRIAVTVSIELRLISAISYNRIIRRGTTI